MERAGHDGAEFLDGRVHVRVGRQQDHEDIRIDLPDLLQHGNAVKVGEPVVQDREVHAGPRLSDGRRAVLRFQDGVARRGESPADRPPDQLFVINDQDCFVCHKTRRCGKIGAAVEKLRLAASRSTKRHV